MSNNCAYCGKGFIRSHPSQRFCGKRKGRHVCKDAFHNTRRVLSGDLSQARKDFLKRNQHPIATPQNTTSVQRAIREDHRDSWEQYVDSIHPFSEEAFQGF
jgi:hypothetical protein